MIRLTALVRRHPILTYFGLAYLISATALLALDGPALIGAAAPLGNRGSLALFPVMVIWVCVAGVGLTGLMDGAAGRRDLAARLLRVRGAPRWYGAAILIPPMLILLTLLVLSTLVSPRFAPRLFPLGILFGIVAGGFEEVGWTGFAFPRLRRRLGALSGALVLGMLWGLWHAPIVDFLGTAGPHGASWLPFFLAFVALTTAMRVLISWVYVNTESLLLAQLMHASSTGFLALLSPAGVSAADEALWYAIYAAVLWVAVGVVARHYGKALPRTAVGTDRAVTKVIVDRRRLSLPIRSGRA